MLENGHSNLQTKFAVHITSNIFKIIQFKIKGSHQPPSPPNFESLPYPVVRGRFDFFFAKMKGKDELEGTRSNFTPWKCDFEHQCENSLGGCCNLPFGELGLSFAHHFIIYRLFQSGANKNQHQASYEEKPDLI